MFRFLRIIFPVVFLGAVVHTAQAQADRVPPASVFTNLCSYYNTRYRVHGYCGTDACSTGLWAKGFGRIVNAGIVGKIVAASPASLAEARKACPNGGKFLKLAHMIPHGRGFMHSFNGGTPQGYVPTKKVCGANLAVRAYSPVIGNDIVYTYGRPPTGYRVLYRGSILFYVWPL